MKLVIAIGLLVGGTAIADERSEVTARVAAVEAVRDGKVVTIALANGSATACRVERLDVSWAGGRKQVKIAIELAARRTEERRVTVGRSDGKIEKLDESAVVSLMAYCR
jgi:hypothetical protein